MSSLQKPKVPVGGLALGPNNLDAPPGNFLVAENVVHRRAGVLEPLPGEHYFMDTTNAQYSRVFSDWEPPYPLRVRKQTADDFGQLLDTSDIAYAAHFRPGETQAVFADGRHILSGADHVVIVDSNGGVASSPRRAGLPQVAGLEVFSVVDTTGSSTQTTVATGKVVAYTAIVRRTLPGGRFLNSAPCSKVTTPIESFPANYTLTVGFDPTATSTNDLYAVGDEILLFRTAQADSVAELNDTFYLAAVHKLTVADLAGSATIQDNTLESNLGEELYTNPGQQGAVKANVVPPKSSGVETYVNTTFYINKSSAPTLTVTVVGAFGQLPTAIDDATKQQRKNGIGIRAFTGNTTASSHDITNVSANDRLGLAIGQAVFGGDLSGARYITAITGAGPYTVTVDRTFASTGGPVSFTSEDVIQVAASKDGVVTTSEWLLFGQLKEAQDSLQTMQSLAAVAMHGFVITAGTFASIVTGSIYDDQVSFEISVTSPDLWDSFDVTFTNPSNWAQSDKNGLAGSYKTVSSIQETRRNVVWYGKTNLPEDVSPVQFILVGSGTVYRLLNVQSTMLAFCSDGIFKIHGQGDVWSVLPVDSSARLVHPDCVQATGALGFAWLEQGLCAVSETGVQNIGKDAIGPQLKQYTKTLYGINNGPQWLWGPSLVIDRHSKDVWLNIVYLPTGSAVQKYATYIFNTETGIFTTAGNTYTALSYFPQILTLIRARNGFSGNGMYRPSDGLPLDYLPATVVYQPFVENAGEVKQWVDVNYFFDNVPADSTGVYDVEALFGGELTSSTNLFGLNASQAPGVLFALHSLVPRRCARDVKLVFGFRTSIAPDSDHPSGGYYFEFKGAALRARVASQIIKR